MERTYAETLKKLRGNRTIVEVSKGIGISPAALSMYENGRRVPRDNIKQRIADYYGRSVGYIFFNNSTRK